MQLATVSDIGEWYITRGEHDQLYSIDYRPNIKSYVAGPFICKSHTEEWIAGYEEAEIERNKFNRKLYIGSVLCGALVGSVAGWLL